MGATPAAGTSAASAPRLQRDSRLGTYFEYDLSKMVNSKGGFLIADDKEIDEATRRKELERERQRTMQNLEPPIHLDLDKNPKCQECQTIDIDHTYKKVFGCLVCKRCTKEKPERYSLLTKTECKEDYLLTDRGCLLPILSIYYLTFLQPNSATRKLCLIYLKLIHTNPPLPT